ncbi:MAG TPA: hypothetical protein VEX39_17745 [Thermoleophilaceae bacterium]|nr:hypothetical protein [Thermoleophilaceae bacterium]
MEEAPQSKKGRGRIAAAAVAGVAAVAIAVPVTGAFAESSSSSTTQPGSSSQAAPAFDDVRSGESQRDGRDCPKKDGQQGGNSASGASTGTPGSSQQL